MKNATDEQVEIRVMQIQLRNATDHQQTTRTEGKTSKDSLQVSEKTWPCCHLDFSFQPPEL